MRLIPGKTKVQIELFKGDSLWDLIIGGIGIAMVLLVLFSSLPFKLAISIGVFVFTGLLIVRLDTEPNYMMMLNIDSGYLSETYYPMTLLALCVIYFGLGAVLSVYAANRKDVR